jgi:thioesterase domain-containing protein
MRTTQLESYLHEHIPLSSAMQVSVVSVDADGVVLTAPLLANINHRDTVFGGSASALAILAAWSLLHVRLRPVKPGCRLVIQRNTVSYDAPICGDFAARSRLSDPDAWQRFCATLDRHGRARLGVSCVLESEGVPCGSFEGTFVAIDTAHRREGRAGGEAPR